MFAITYIRRLISNWLLILSKFINPLSDNLVKYHPGLLTPRLLQEQDLIFQLNKLPGMIKYAGIYYDLEILKPYQNVGYRLGYTYFNHEDDSIYASELEHSEEIFIPNEFQGNDLKERIFVSKPFVSDMELRKELDRLLEFLELYSDVLEFQE